MTSMITPPVMTNAAAQPAAQAGTRSRAADEDQGRSFGAALERSRSNNTGEAAQEGPQDAAALDRKPTRKPDADEDAKDDGTLPADPNLAFLAPPNSPLHALTLAGRAARKQGGDGAADATAAAAATATTAKDIALDPALQAPATKTLAGDAATTAIDAKAVPEAAAAAKDAAAKPATSEASALPGTQASAAQPDAAQATSLHELARAAIAAQTMSTGFAKPASTPAGAPVGTAAIGRAAGSRAPMSATTAEQLASAAQPAAAADAQADKAALAVVTAAASGSADGADSQPAVPPAALQQPAPATTAASEHASEASATARTSVHTIAPEVGSDKWAPALGQHLARMSTSGSHTAELNLNPAGLGPLKVTLSMGDNQAQAMFVSAHESVRKAVEAALPQLRNSLSEQGITLGQASVGAETRQPFGNGAAFAQQQGQQQHGAARQQAASSYPGADRTVAGASAATAAVRPAAPDHARSGVDTFA
ncbi:flagellar hook-length control protein FliK [Variovorax sp. UC74_104]|uniref:flagellar hook-length control protein FliK n=1 Tax=Variovorax sp. UC74_104 TaxID=3374555 RepID=UPI003756AD60